MNNNVKPSDKEILEDILNSLKGVSDLFMHGTIESSSENVNNTFNDALFETLQLQKQTFDQMKNNGFYQIQAIDQNKITQAKNKLSSKI